MIKTSIEKLAEDIGFDIGNSDNETQAKLINGLAKGLEAICGRGNLEQPTTKYEIQLVYVEKELIPEAKRFIKALYNLCKESQC